MSGSLVSVIIPVYNSSEHLNDCLKSVSSQKNVNLEIICINDGSTDRSQDLIDQHASHDSRVRCIVQENKGVSAARNAGLEIASGEFIAFVDSDDMIEPNYLDRLLTNMKPDTDIVIESNLIDADVHFENISDYLYWGLRTGAINTPWGKLFRRSLISTNDLKFSQSTSLGEDLLFNVQLATLARSATVLPGTRYTARPVEGSLTRSYRPQKYIELMFVHDNISATLLNHQLSNLQSVLNFRRIRALVSAARSLRSDQSGLRRKMRNRLITQMERENTELRVRDGDTVMRIVGMLYNTFGLNFLTNCAEIFHKLGKGRFLA